MTDLLLDEHLADDGAPQRTWLRAEGAELALVAPDATRPLPDGAVEAVFARFGGDLADDVRLVDEGLVLPSGARLRRLRHLAQFDVIGRDYLVLEAPGAPPRVLLAVTATAALAHLARAAAP